MLHGEVKGRSPRLIPRCGVAADVQQVFDGCRALRAGCSMQRSGRIGVLCVNCCTGIEQAGDGFYLSFFVPGGAGIKPSAA